MKLFANLESLGLPTLLAGAEKHILLHAAIYGPFAAQALYKEALFCALARKTFKKLDIIALTESSPEVLQKQYLDLLRHGSSAAEKSQEVAASDAFLKILKETAPEKVNIYSLRTFSCQPILIIDDTMIFGQYVCSQKKAAEGFWGVVETDMEKLFNFALTHLPLPVLTDKETAAYRLICDCCHAMAREKN